MLHDAPPLALYAHFPWCVQKCPYCDFNSHKAPGQIPEQRYIDALLEDLQLDLQALNQGEPRPLVSIFMGGGTPSLFSPDAIARFLEGVRRLLPCEPDTEVTLEANPGTIEHGRFAGYRAAGVTRVSLGAQSFRQEQLLKLGRIHGSRDIAVAVDELRRAGLNNFNLDLMYGLPQQAVQEALDDVQQAIALQPAHISHYQLTLEPGTAFFHQPPALPEGEDCYDMQLQCQALLAEAGYLQYEVSAYARAGRQSVHNRNYWQFGDYFGLGAGAHGKLSAAGEIVRTERRKQPREYLEVPVAQRVRLQAVPTTELPFEFMLNALRLIEGFDQALFENRTGLASSVVASRIKAAQRCGLLEVVQDTHWRPTEFGRRFLNDLVSLFLSDEP